MDIGACVEAVWLPYAPQAVETLKDIERKGSKMASAAATNLSFIYFLVSVYMHTLCCWVQGCPVCKVSSTPLSSPGV